MKPKIIFILGILSLLFVPLFLSEPGSNAMAREAVTSPNTGITWYGYNEGMALARQSEKKVLLHFYATWCGYCKKMDKEVFSSKDVAAFMNLHFVPIRLDSDVEKALAAQYQITGLPTTWFMDPNGTKLQSLPGYLPKDLFLAYLTYIQTDSYKEKSFKAFMGAK